MIVAVLKEGFPGENRVALIPPGVASLRKHEGVEVAVEASAGTGALRADGDYEAEGARIEANRARLLSEADIVLAVRGPGADPGFPARDLDRLKQGAIMAGFLEPLAQPEVMRSLAERGVTAFAMELIPRTTRAQSMDALSSMANIAGYEAVLIAAAASAKIFPLMMTAAGTMAPARVLVIGAGVAGLQAIATAKRLGAVVEGYDIRPEVKEQVESLGARFVEFDLQAAEGKGGYAAQQSKEFYQRQQELMAKHLESVDIVITTAAVPGKRAPILITEEMTQHLRPGAIVVDLAAEKGGNCAVTQPGEVVDYRGITVIGTLNLASKAAYHASQMYSKNMTTFLDLLLEDGTANINLEDDIIAGTLVTRAGEITHPAVKKALEETP